MWGLAQSVAALPVLEQGEVRFRAEASAARRVIVPLTLDLSPARVTSQAFSGFILLPISCPYGPMRIISPPVSSTLFCVLGITASMSHMHVVRLPHVEEFLTSRVD